MSRTVLNLVTLNDGTTTMYRIMTKKLVIRESENTKAEGRGIFCFTNDDVSRLLSVLNAR